MHADTKLSIAIDATCTRSQYTSDSAPVIAELRALAGDRVDVLAEAAGTWLGYFEDEHTRVLCSALRELPGVDPWIPLGQHRRTARHHGTPTLGERAVGH